MGSKQTAMPSCHILVTLTMAYKPEMEFNS